MLRSADKQTNRYRQTDRQTDSKILPTPTDRVGVGRPNSTPFPTTIMFFPHSLGGDTSTITLQPRFVVIRYSLGGDTDNSKSANPRRIADNNTAWVRTL